MGKNYKEKQLKPCPFCGGDFKDESYDRGQVFKCESCGYHRWFPGLLTTEPNDHPIPYKRETPINKFESLRKRYMPNKLLRKYPIKTKDEKVPQEEVKYQEYYHNENVQKAIDEMNKRWGG